MKTFINFSDHRPHQASLQDAVIEGLSGEKRSIPPKYFYDTRGSELFEQICSQPEYYIPNAECEILQCYADEIADLTDPGCVLIEPGAGNSSKVRFLLDALRPSVYVPMDISGDFLVDSASVLAREYPWLNVHAAHIDFVHHLALPEELPDRHRVVFFPGSSLGNFEPQEAVIFLKKISATIGRQGALIIGIDVKKDKSILDAAYNDKQGVTAAFNLNLLERINRELRANFKPERFAHKAFFNEAAGRIEMHLVSECDQRVQVDGHVFEFSTGDSIHTEYSYKYTPHEFHQLASRAGFRSARYWLDSRALFSVHYLTLTS